MQKACLILALACAGCGGLAPVGQFPGRIAERAGMCAVGIATDAINLPAEVITGRSLLPPVPPLPAPLLPGSPAQAATPKPEKPTSKWIWPEIPWVNAGGLLMLCLVIGGGLAFYFKRLDPLYWGGGIGAAFAVIMVALSLWRQVVIVAGLVPVVFAVYYFGRRWKGRFVNFVQSNGDETGVRPDTKAAAEKVIAQSAVKPRLLQP